MLRSRPPSDRGTVLLLFPAALLIVMLLGSIAIDFGLVHLRHQEVEDLAASAANDAAQALALDSLYDVGATNVSPELAVATVARTVAARGLDGVVIAAVAVDGDEVSVTLHLDVEYVIAPIVPGAGDGQRVTGTAIARILPDVP